MSEFEFKVCPEYETYAEPPYRARTGRTSLTFAGTITDAFADDLLAVIDRHVGKIEAERLQQKIDSALATNDEDRKRIDKRTAEVAEMKRQLAALEFKR